MLKFWQPFLHFPGALISYGAVSSHLALIALLLHLACSIVNCHATTYPFGWQML
jgi:hypothetical protein